jgi:CRISPR-associated endonuclease/helicase Cas3
MFLSHPKEERILLQDHLTKVARIAASLISTTNYSTSLSEAAFYSGLLHDIGKLNPYYQEIFHAERKMRENLQKEMLSKYDRQHSLFSAWAADHLLQGATLNNNSISIDPRIHNLILAVIAGHHTKLSKRILSNRSSSINFQNSKEAIAKVLPKFNLEVSSSSFSSSPASSLSSSSSSSFLPPSDGDFARLNWEECIEEFRRPISFQGELRARDEGVATSFVEASVLFSALIQSDRGSFSDWLTPSYDLTLDTRRLVRRDSRLGMLREKFQREVIDRYDAISDNIAVIHAPTGIGKTKIFLDLISRYSSLERVIYFSPLLALTEDFEEKMRQVAENSLDEILIYNHLFSGMISERVEGYAMQPTSDAWNFINESFNSKFIISTTQRLILTLYSNRASDKLKLVSFKNSLLILDEIQVVPKFLLPNLVAVLRELCVKMNSKVLLVSATVPHEIREAGLSMYETSREIWKQYNALTRKQVQFAEDLNLPSVFVGKVLLMTNTRRKAIRLLDKVNNAKGQQSKGEEEGSKNKEKDAVRSRQRGRKQDSEDLPIYYLSSGVRKKTRAEILAKVKSHKECILVSTQVVEAGVDISFTEVYREAAPLDNIIQVMGRLNREGEVTSPILHIFRTDIDHRPYSELEYRESLKILQTIHNSEELYEKLGEYYRIVSLRNAYNRKIADRLIFLEKTMDFDGVSELISKHVVEQDDVSVLIPESEEELEHLKLKLLYTKRMDRNTFKKYAGLAASLPRNMTKDKLSQLFDQELIEKRNLLVPKRGKLEELYDSKVGLDKWLR